MAMWNTYIWVDDADLAAKKATEAGGAVLSGPFDVMDAGRMAVLADTEGAAFCVWQPKDHRGAQVVNEHGSLNFNGLATRDVEAAKRFYAEVFGLQPSLFPGAEGQPYTILSVGEEGVAGILDMGDMFPPEVPNNWTTIFGTDDTDATMAKALELGGSVMREAFDIDEVGRVGYLVGPHGETFGLLKPAPMP